MGERRGRVLPGVSNLRPLGRMWLRITMNAAQHEIINLLKHSDIFAITCCNALNVWPNTTALPVWPRNSKELVTLDETKTMYE